MTRRLRGPTLSATTSSKLPAATAVVILALAATACGSHSHTGNKVADLLADKCKADTTTVLNPIVGLDEGSSSLGEGYQFAVTYKDKSGQSHIGTISAVAQSGLTAGTALGATDLTNLVLVTCDVEKVGS